MFFFFFGGGGGGLCQLGDIFLIIECFSMAPQENRDLLNYSTLISFVRWRNKNYTTQKANGSMIIQLSNQDTVLLVIHRGSRKKGFLLMVGPPMS